MTVSLARSRPAPGLLAGFSEAERWLLAVLAALLIVVATLLGGLAQGGPWLESAPPRGGAAPHWLATETVRATSSDGEVVKARVALDVPDADTRDWINNRQRQVTLAMQASVADTPMVGIGGTERVLRLSENMQERLNELLEASDLPPVRSVVIQDLVVAAR